MYFGSFQWTADALTCRLAGDQPEPRYRRAFDLQAAVLSLALAAPLSTWVPAAHAQSPAELPATVRTQQDPFDRLLSIERGQIASSWSSLPDSIHCRDDDKRLAVHALGLAEPSRAALEQHTGSFDLLDPRYRAQADVSAQAGCVFGQLAVQRQVGVDGDFWSMDGSAVSWQMAAHWRVGAGLIARQWGPGWDGSLILGTAARALPSVTLDADTGPIARDSFWWWLGQLQFTGFVGRLESDRGDYPHPWLLGMRMVIRPIDALELGLSRTAQMGGEGRDNSLRALWNAILGRDNQDGDPNNQPGNQLGGFDARYSLDRWLPGVAVYGQMIGEDEAASLPSKYMYQVGASWRNSRAMAFVEWTDSTAGIPGVAYNHHIYTDGYRYRGRPLGHWADGDSSVWTLGGLWDDAVLGQALAVLRAGKLNDTGASTTWPTSDLLAASLQWRKMLDRSVRLTVAADYFQLNVLPGTAAATRDRDAQVRVQLEWWH